MFLTVYALTAASLFGAPPPAAPPPTQNAPPVPVKSAPVTKASPLLAASPAALSATKAADDPLLPLTIPGYELRTLDRRKDVLFNVNGTWVRASVPVFVYYPTDAKPKAEALARLRDVYGSILQLSHKPAWSAAELQAVITNLDASLQLLEKGR